MQVDVALPLPIPHNFTYSVHDQTVAEGCRVLVPFGRRQLVGWVVSISGDSPADQVEVRPVTQVLDVQPSVPGELLELSRWLAHYYMAPLGLVLRAALPAALSRRSGARPAVRTRRILRLVKELGSLRLRDEVFQRAPRQRECYEMVEALGGSVETVHLTKRLGFSGSVLRGLVERGVAEVVEQEAERDPFAGLEDAEAETLVPTSAQADAIAQLRAAARGSVGGEADEKPFLLRGVTGSGKTFVYLELLREVVQKQGRGAIVLVPEIALTPQTVGRFRARFGHQVAVLHSGLSDGERYDAWRALREGRKRIAIGARSAVFAPVPDLGAIILDEEHEATYKQSDAEPRYHAREVAIVRARAAGGVCVLGSATPSLESWRNAKTGKFRLLELPDRIAMRAMPPVHVLDLRQPSPGSRQKQGGEPGRGVGPGSAGGSRAAGDGAARIPVLAPELVTAMQARLDRGEQSILLLNRRGFSAYVQCFGCGQVVQCRRCNVSLTFHRLRRRLLCHYCHREEVPPSSCSSCGGEQLSYRGLGTEQVEEAVTASFPGARVARMDVDTTSGKWAHRDILGRFGRRELDILLGTQMIAKGLDFPLVTLVGIINADVGLNLPDYRAGERSFQLLTQVAGRAGRGESGGEVFVQTAMPDNYVVRFAARHDFVGFAECELEERAGPPYPPHCRLANVVVSGLREDLVRDTAASFAARARKLNGELGSGKVEVVGPAPCPIERVRGRWRWHFLLRSVSANQLGEIGRRLLGERPSPGPGRIRLIIDRDPVALL